ncbi:sensor histidine kinase [Actinoplanes philippinensis]|uniref:sensor histidine kinase n=1 Tax=Actinoplanes philippinensis TaxID=35752 RepID=UPI0015A7242F|nr:histidine kinase [Actinoplanes philippinensis]
MSTAPADPGRSVLAVDVTAGGCFLVALLAERFMLDPVPSGDAVAAVLAGVLLAVAVALRRRLPFPAFLVSAAALCLEALATPASWLSPYANLLVVFSVARHGSRRQAWLALAGTVVCIGVYFTARDDVQRLTQPLGVLVVWLSMWAVGYAMARRQEEQRTIRRLDRERAVAVERARIARELHDLIGHTVNLMLVQAGASRRLLDRDPARARELLTALEGSGRDALTELDRVLGVLGDTAPADGDRLDRLPDLVRRVSEAGLLTTLDIGAEVRGLPDSLSLTAYRIVQEGLTNALRHAGARHAWVTVRHEDGWLDIIVRDDGRGAAGGYRAGRGLLGIGERAAMFDGTVTHGPGPGGFGLHCRLRS